MVTTSTTRAIFTVVMTIVSVFAIPSMILTSGVVASVSAQSASSLLLTEQIKVSREISAPIDQVWNIVSNVIQRCTVAIGAYVSTAPSCHQIYFGESIEQDYR